MPSEIKWLIGFIISVILIFAIGLFTQNYMEKKCVKEFANSSKTVNEINALCR